MMHLTLLAASLCSIASASKLVSSALLSVPAVTVQTAMKAAALLIMVRMLVLLRSAKKLHGALWLIGLRLR